MQVDSQYLGELQELTHTKQETIQLDHDATLSQLMVKLTGDYGQDFRLRVDRKNGYAILINGRHFETLKAGQTILQEGDKVVFLPITQGG